jgi:actin-related protein
MFETYNVPALYVSVQAVLSLFAAGRTSGIVLDSGEGASDCVPILEGRVQTQCMPRPFYFAGHDLTEHMLKLLNRSGHKVDDHKIARDVKEKLCYVALDYEQEMAKTSSAQSFKLPDGRSITIDKEGFCCPEALFRSELISMEMSGLHMLINNAIMKCDEKNRKDLYSNIVLAGGSTMFPGMGDRMQKEIVSIAPPSAKVKVIASPQRQNSVWLGGSLLVTMSTFKHMWISRKEYNEYGPAIIHQNCQ